MRSPRHSVVRYVYFDRLEGHRCGSTRLKNNRKGFLVANKSSIGFQLDFNTKIFIFHITTNDISLNYYELFENCLQNSTRNKTSEVKKFISI